MRTSLNEIHAIEQYLLGKTDNGESLLLEARLQIDPQLRLNVRLQRKLMMVVKHFFRRKLKRELNALSVKIFSDPEKHEFQQKILQTFNQK
jgi:hypothetical protein